MSDAPKEPGVLQRVCEAFLAAFEQIGATATPAEVENLAFLVHRLMSDNARFYHCTLHVFDLFTNARDEPHACLAALFHDLVYVQVDQGIEAEAKEILQNYVTLLPSGQYQLRESLEPEAKGDIFTLASGIFGFRPGHVLGQFAGQNEFLSAILAGAKLSPIISREHLTHVLAYIEATIPFREHSEQKSWCRDLVERLEGQGIAHEAAVETVKRTVLLGNRDVGGFGARDCRVFLNNTWNLIPESNPLLRHPGIFTIQAYRTVLMKNIGFFKSLNVERVFHRFENSPPEDVHAALLHNARRNLAIGTLYVKCKLLPIAVMEAIVHLTGGDGPISMFLGDVRGGARIDHFLPKIAPLEGDEGFAYDDASADYFEVVARLLRYGRGKASAFDLEQSPTAAYMQSKLSVDDIPSLWDLCTQFFDGKMPPLKFLQAQSRVVVRDLILAMSKVAVTRAAALTELAAKFA